MSEVKFFYFLFISFILLTACDDKTNLKTTEEVSFQLISRNYYLKRSSIKSILNEPSYSSLELVIKEESTNKIITISDNVGKYNTSTYKDFSWKVYKDNIAYVKMVDEAGETKFYLYVYSPSKGNILVDKDLRDYWKVEATDKGIRCLPYLNGERSENVTPVIYTAEYLSNLGTKKE